jgi:GTP-binding protein
VRVTAATFVGAASAVRHLPAPGPPEVAVGGRSNVGKSSFLNMLLGRRRLARTSRTPGRTRQINVFDVNAGTLRIVDLPGYGFAVGPESERRAWGPLVEGYLRSRPTLVGMLVLVDARRGIEDEEERLREFLVHVGIPHALIVTKLDKLRRGAAGAALRTLTAAWPGPVVGCSAHTGAGRAAAWRVVHGWLDAASGVGHNGPA